MSFATHIGSADAAAAHAVPIVAVALRNAVPGPVDLGAETAATRWVKVRRGSYVAAAAWAGLPSDAQLLVRAHAVAKDGETARLFSHCTAARVWGLPMIGRPEPKVEVLVSDGRTGRTPGVIRRRTQNLPSGQLLHGLCVTGAARTAVDLARVQSLASAVSVFDDVLRRRLATRDELPAQVNAVPRGGRGRRQAGLAVALADPASESAGESLSRVRLWEAGFARPSLQDNIFDARGFVGRVDMFWEELAVVGEFDGRIKYAVDQSQSSEQAAENLWREKLREDRLRALGLTVVRWTWDEALHANAMLSKLRVAGVRNGHETQWPSWAPPSGVGNVPVAYS
ncbi:MAG: hypothetical protein M3Y49_08960 [Actinomycetota bacterium]|nr:hypothetical protein [Actinomycetota bacterium]